MRYFLVDISGTSASVNKDAKALRTVSGEIMLSHEYGMCLYPGPDACCDMCKWVAVEDDSVTGPVLFSMLADHGVTPRSIREYPRTQRTFLKDTVEERFDRIKQERSS
jgi:hypothetical protein